jgi:hypothetical protein
MRLLDLGQADLATMLDGLFPPGTPRSAPGWRPVRWSSGGGRDVVGRHVDGQSLVVGVS